MTDPTQEQAQAAMERVRSAHAFGNGIAANGVYIMLTEQDRNTLLALLEASARALGPFAKIGHEVNYTCPDERKLVGPWASSTAFDFREAHRVLALIAPKGEG